MKTAPKTIIAGLALLLALFTAGRAQAQIPGMNFSDEIRDYISQAIPPYVGKVTITPENPADSQDVTVTASIAAIHFADQETTEVGDAIISYTTDGGATWTDESMEQSDDNPELWVGVIPGMSAGTSVEYRVRATTEVSDFKFMSRDKEVRLSLGETQDVEFPPSMNLAGYNSAGPDGSPFEHLATVAVDKLGAEDNIAPEANIQSVGFGDDGDNYYFRLKYENKIDGGTLSPFNARVYLGFILNLNRGFEDFDATKTSMSKYVEQIQRLIPLDNPGAMAVEGSKRIFAWFWAPLADAVPPLPEIGKIPRQALIKLNPNNITVPIFDTEDMKTNVAEDGTVDISIKKTALGDDTDMLMFFFGCLEASGGSVTDFKNISFKIPDVSYPTILKFVEHKYTVQ